MGRWGRGSTSKQPKEDAAGGGASDDGRPLAPLQLVSGCEPDDMLARLRTGEDGLDLLGPEGWGCLHHAASLGMRGHVEALLDAKANALLKTAAPLGSFAKGITALQVAQSVHKAGRGDRTQLIETLQLGVQANGWGDWRTLKASDGQRQVAMASSGTLPASSPRPKPSAAAGGAQGTVSAAKLEEAVAAAEDRVRWAMRNELAARESAAQLVEVQLLEAKERESGWEHRVKLMTKQLDGMSTRERDAKAAAAVASTAKVAAEKAAEEAERKATKESVARRRAVSAAKAAQMQAEEAGARAETAEAESARMAAALTLAESSRADAEAARADAEAAAKRQVEELRMMIAGSAAGMAGAPEEEAPEPAADGPLQQIMAQATELNERCNALTADLGAADAARAAAETESARLEVIMQEQAAAAAAAAAANATQAANALREEVERRVAAEELSRELRQELDSALACTEEELGRQRAADAARKAEQLRSKHGTAAKALAKMAHRGLGRAMGGWVAAVQRLKRHRALLQRAAGRFVHGAMSRAFNGWLTWADANRRLGNAERESEVQREALLRELEAVEAVRVGLAGQVAKLRTELVTLKARHDAAMARVEEEAQRERKSLQAAVLRPEAAAQQAKLEAEFLARQTAFYSRQLALTSRQHARYVSSVAAAVGEQRGPMIVPHAALAGASLPLPMAAEIIRPNSHHDVPTDPDDSSELVTSSASGGTGSDGSHEGTTSGASTNGNWQQQRRKPPPTQQAAYASNALAALGVLYTSVSMSLSSKGTAGHAAGQAFAGGGGGGGGSEPGQGPPQQELALLAIETLQQDILSYLRRHPLATVVEWLKASGLQQASAGVAGAAGTAGVSGNGSAGAGVIAGSPRSTSPSALEGAARAYSSSSPTRDQLLEGAAGGRNRGSSAGSSRTSSARRVRGSSGLSSPAGQRSTTTASTGSDHSASGSAALAVRRRRRPMSAQPAVGSPGTRGLGRPGSGSSSSSSLRRVKRPFTAGSTRGRVRGGGTGGSVSASPRVLQPMIDVADI